MSDIQVSRLSPPLEVFFFRTLLTPVAIAANTSAEQTFTVPGLPAGATVFVNKPTTQAGLAIVNNRVTAANTLGIAFGNFTAAPITPTAGEQYEVIAFIPRTS